MNQGDTIEFNLPNADGFRTGRIEEFTTVEGTEMPFVTDHIDRQYPVHPDNIENVIPVNN